jgi:hypothetical protein
MKRFSDLAWCAAIGILIFVGLTLFHTHKVRTASAPVVLPQIPGAITLKVKQTNLYKTVCVKGYTSTIRPPTSYTNALKAAQIVQLGYKDQKLSSYEEDHLVALSIGGDPYSVRNLWPQPWAQAHADDVYEYSLYRKVCNGLVTLYHARKYMIAYKHKNG